MATARNYLFGPPRPLPTHPALRHEDALRALVVYNSYPELLNDEVKALALTRDELLHALRVYDPALTERGLSTLQYEAEVFVGDLETISDGVHLLTDPRHRNRLYWGPIVADLSQMDRDGRLVEWARDVGVLVYCGGAENVDADLAKSPWVNRGKPVDDIDTRLARYERNLVRRVGRAEIPRLLGENIVVACHRQEGVPDEIDVLMRLFRRGANSQIYDLANEALDIAVAERALRLARDDRQLSLFVGSQG